MHVPKTEMPGKEQGMTGLLGDATQGAQLSTCPRLSSTQQGSEDTLRGSVRDDTLGDESLHSSRSHQSHQD